MTTPGESGDNFGHMHIGACLPERQSISGVVTVDVRIILHDNPGSFDYLNPVLKSDDQELSINKNFSLQGFTCPVGDCVRWTKVSFDTRLIESDGLQEIRIRAYVNEPDGAIMHSSINGHSWFRNGNPVDDVDRKVWKRGKGWYTDSGYCEASLVSPYPTAPVSGTWSPVIRMTWHGASDDLPLTHHTIRLNPDFHAHPTVPGIVVRDGPGELPEGPVAIDTTKLANGRNVLHLRADCEDPRGSTNSGVLIVPFTVAN